jgi:hypothetical protein
MKHRSDGFQAAAADCGTSGIVGTEAITTMILEPTRPCPLLVTPVEPFALFQWFTGQLIPAN